jgi:diguanylate cyclase (GGDEF)-like protein
MSTPVLDDSGQQQEPQPSDRHPAVHYAELEGVARVASFVCGGLPTVVVVDEVGPVAAYGVALDAVDEAIVVADLVGSDSQVMGSLRVLGDHLPSAEALARLDDLAVQAAHLLDRRLLQAAFARASGQDPVTALPNRRTAEQALGAAIARAERGLGTPSVVVVDLDGFAELNRSRGANAGDAVLRSVGTRLRMTSRTVDLVARIGPDEFLVLLESTGGPGAVAALARLRSALAAGAGDLADLPVSASLGMTTYRPGDGVASLISRADAELYAEKARHPAP